MDEKIVIKYVDELVNDFIKNPFEEFTVSDFLHDHQRHISERKDLAETHKLEDAIEIFGRKKHIFDVYDGHLLKLSDKGIELKDFGKGYLKFINKESLNNHTTLNYISGDNYGIQSSDGVFKNPTIKQTKEAPISKPPKKSLLKKIYSDPWVIGIGLIIIEEIFIGYLRGLLNF